MEKGLDIQLKDPIYRFFLTEFTHEVKKNWHRRRNALALEAGVAPSLITDIIKENTKPSYGTRAALVEALRKGYCYLSFIEDGKKRIASSSQESKSETKVNIESESDTGENEKVIESQKKMIALLERQVDRLERNEDRLLAEIYELKADIKKLKSEIDELKLRNNELEGMKRALEKEQSQTHANPVKRSARKPA